MALNTQKLSAYARLMRIDRPIGTLLLLWPTLWALVLASRGLPEGKLLVVFTLGVFLMRAAGCVINDYADRNFDGSVKRTALRPLATGEVTAREAKWLFVALSLLAFLLVLTLNRYAIGLSFIAIALAFIYPFMKRYTHLPQFVLGAAFGWSIPMAYAAVSNALPLACWLLFIANILWTVAYDTQYAMVDRDDDLRIGVKSTAILFAQYDNKIIAALQAGTVALFIAIGALTELHWLFYVLLILPTALFIYQARLTHNRERMACFNAFLNNNYVGLTFFLAICAGVFIG
ncbi:4-hydroxybenzoate octaprenyltransferase [Pasteurellaceae bacterium 20609_3]|uniref:4-hydroxybenzoate octaprenyltransferase n=1 Tax=Spirabiliibacterium mucosae TaxID=28156 RepID=UPI001AAD338D|nr:4-hydroxybenzoate octaprenyltransferase [Spirabiliibacterium mucosae]MBE2898553.1 4-hydroxybenzoate octaprenyltransferase [Spirabiliibacterium mucosae]